MIETLTNQFAELCLRILRFVACHPVDKGDFRPDNQAQCITTRIKIFRLLIMSKTHGRGTDIHNLSQVKIMFTVGQRTPQAPPVLMTGNTIHRIFLSIKIETFSGNNFVMTNTQRLRDLVNHLTICQQTGDYFVKIRVLPTLPEMRIL